jgi:hypothetical protein
MDKPQMLETGHLVKWEVSGNEMHGVFMQYLDDKAEIMCFKMGEIRCGFKTVVSTNLLSKIEGV